MFLKSFGPNRFIFGAAGISGEAGGYSFGSMGEKTAQTLVKTAFEWGVRIFDTAPIYGFGTSEERLGIFLKSERDKVCLISKSGVDWHSTKRVNMTNNPKITEKMLHESLKRLNTDYIDLYMIHWPDENVDIRLPLEVLYKAKERGKIREIGLCNTNIEDLNKAEEIVNIVGIQSEYNLFNRSVEGLLERLSKSQEFMSWGTFDKGILTGTVTEKRTFESSDCRSWAPWWKAIDKKARYKAVENLLVEAKKWNLGLEEIAIGHNLSHPRCDFVLCGVKSIDQLRSALEATKVCLTADQRETTREICQL